MKVAMKMGSIQWQRERERKYEEDEEFTGYLHT
jgi:hypothetical protein